MHTLSVTYEGIEYSINHNGDWSGEAYVTWTDANGEHKEVELPGRIFVACSRAKVISEAIAALENLEDPIDLPHTNVGEGERKTGFYWIQRSETDIAEVAFWTGMEWHTIGHSVLTKELASKVIVVRGPM